MAWIRNVDTLFFSSLFLSFVHIQFLISTTLSLSFCSFKIFFSALNDCLLNDSHLRHHLVLSPEWTSRWYWFFLFKTDEMIRMLCVQRIGRGLILSRWMIGKMKSEMIKMMRIVFPGRSAWMRREKERERRWRRLERLLWCYFLSVLLENERLIDEKMKKTFARWSMLFFLPVEFVRSLQTMFSMGLLNDYYANNHKLFVWHHHTKHLLPLEEVEISSLRWSMMRKWCKWIRNYLRWDHWDSYLDEIQVHEDDIRFEFVLSSNWNKTVKNKEMNDDCFSLTVESSSHPRME